MTLFNHMTLRLFKPALRHLLKEGLPDSGELCHSPMAFLSRAIDQVLALVKTTQGPNQDRTARRRAQEQAELDAAQREEAEEAAFRKRQEAFMKAFPGPDERAELIHRYRAKYPSLPVAGLALKSLVVSAWWSEGHGRG